jgi:hypothetical protein
LLALHFGWIKEPSVAAKSVSPIVVVDKTTMALVLLSLSLLVSFHVLIDAQNMILIALIADTCPGCDENHLGKLTGYKFGSELIFV